MACRQDRDHGCLSCQEARAAGVFDGAWGLLGVPTQPEPVLFPRKLLDQRFAVLLLNSMYDAVDNLDFVPMVRCSLAKLVP